MKIKYIRQEKKSNIKDLTIRVKSDKDEVPNPQFDEYYLYTHETKLSNRYDCTGR